MRYVFLSVAFLLFATALLIISCTKSAGSQSAYTEDCSGAAKSFAKDVNPIIQTYCTKNSRCHADGSRDGVLTTYQGIFNVVISTSMKKSLLALFILAAISATAQVPTLEQAKDTAKAEHKLILLSFSGSDWCIPCIRMEKDVFEKEAFHQYATEHLVVL